jgi:hypothetical protein
MISGVFFGRGSKKGQTEQKRQKGNDETLSAFCPFLFLFALFASF